MSVARVSRALAARTVAPGAVRCTARQAIRVSPRAGIWCRSAEAPTLRYPTTRLYSTEQSDSNKIYDFNAVRAFAHTREESEEAYTVQIKDLSSKPSTERILIDVREPGEYEAGFIPSAINIPVSSQPDALLLPEEEFEDRFGFAKPDVKKEVIFYCKAGVRSAAAAKLAGQGGYGRIGEYKGSWVDWVKRGGESEKP